MDHASSSSVKAQGIQRPESGRRRSIVLTAKPPNTPTCSPNLALLPTQLALLLTMSLVARTSALRRQIVHSRAFVPSRGVHGYKVCALKF
jgi:hypothetical protein